MHSFKDLPTAPADGIRLAAVPIRADARDAFAARDGVTLAKLPGAPASAPVRHGDARSCSPRGPDLEIVGIRGNVDTRLGRLYDPDDDRRVDGLVLAAAGLERLGRLGEASELLPLAVVADRAGAGRPRARDPGGCLRHSSGACRLDRPSPTRIAATAERGVLARLEAGCSAPIAAHASLVDGMLILTATVYAPDGTGELTIVDTEAADPDRAPLDLADRVAAALLDRGAAGLAPLGGAR